MKKNAIIAIIAALVVAAGGILLINNLPKDNDTEVTNNVQVEENSKPGKTDDEEKADEDVSKEEEKVYVPTFMYFVSSKDEDFEKTNEMIEELKKEYDGRVKFEITDIDENPEAKDNFPVEGSTPMLIMLNTANDICAFNPKCSDKELLMQAIESALN